MRTVGSLIALVVSLASLPVGATDTTEPQAVPPPEQHTVTRGTPPQDLPGRWMAVGWIQLPNDKARTTPTLWEIKQDDQLVLTVRFAALPPALQKALDDANTAEQRWRPSPVDIAQLAAAWDALPPWDPRLVSIQNEIVARDGFDETFSNDAKTREAAWVVRQAEQYHPSASPAIKTVNVYAVLEPREGGYFGNFTTATVAAVPLPIPITLSGTFQMYRVDGGAAPPRRGFLGRLLDFLQGCGRR
jgi:hypothetical protein